MVKLVPNYIYRGWVRHRRYQPQAHGFRYRLDISGLSLMDGRRALQQSSWYGWRRPGLLRFHRNDYLQGAPALEQSVRDRVAAELGWAPTGDIRLVTQLRSFGISFNPVSFYVCHNEDGQPQVVLAEITNTPWSERHSYLVDLTLSASHTFRKIFHVSPFHGMQQRYRWTFDVTDRHLVIHMQNYQDDELVFDASMALASQPASASNLFRLALRRPVAPLLTLAAIYRQAWSLWRKRVPVYDHPQTQPSQQRVAGPVPSVSLRSYS